MSFDFHDADVRGVIRMLAGVSGREIIATDDVRGGLTLKLDSVPWEDALAIVARTLNLNIERLGKVIRVTTAERAEADEQARSRTELLHTEVFALRFAHATSVADLLMGERPQRIARGDGTAVVLYPDEVYASGAVGPPRASPLPRPAVSRRPGILSQRGSATADDPTNSLIVSDVQRGVEAVRDVLAHIDRPAPQVEIESRIVEVREDFERSLGVQWGYRYIASNQTGNPTGFNFPGSIGIGGVQTPLNRAGLNTGVDPVTGAIIPFIADFPARGSFGPGAGSAIDLVLGSIDQSQLLDVRLTQLEDEGKLKVISRPRIITRNNQEAVIKSVDVIRIRLPSSTVIGGYANGLAAQSVEIGVALRVRPQVSADGFIMLDLRAISSSLDRLRQVDNIPVQQERETESHVLLRDGQTLVVGGIYRIENHVEWTGIPFLQSIPGLGWLFGSVTNQNDRQDLVIFVTPHRVSLDPVLEAGSALPPARQLWLNRTAASQ